MSRGPQPPLPPRRLSRAQRDAVLRPKVASHHFAGTGFLILGGLVLTVALTFLRPLVLMGAIFLFVGFLLRRTGWPPELRREQQRRLQALRWGLPVLAELTRVERHFIPLLDAGRVVRLDYAFTVRGQRIEGSMPSLHAEDAGRRPGEPVWAVYLAEDPQVSALWQPPP